MNKGIEFSNELAMLFDEKAMELSKLDLNTGDKNHGSTISRGFIIAYNDILKSSSDPAISEVFRVIGHGLLSLMGGQSGLIFSTLFLQAATSLRKSDKLSGPVLNEIVNNTVDDISNLTGIKAGDKTMLDSLIAANEKAKRSLGTLNAVLAALVEGSLEGSEATKTMKAVKGRSGFLGDGSLGFIDAGSRSVYYIMKTMEKVFGNISE
jgi:dihydroxyacetone kinase-like protein